MDPIRVLLAGHRTLIRAGIRVLLEKPPDIEVIAEATDGRETISMVGQYAPQVVLLDAALTVVDGLEVTRHLASAFPVVRVIIVLVHLDEAHIYQALQAGAAGCLSLAAASGELELAIRTVAQGETYLGPTISKETIADYGQYKDAAIDPLKDLSTRQIQVLQLMVEGKSTRQIGVELNISEKTVETHRVNLMNRLDIHDIAGLVHFAIKVGIVSLDD